MVPRNSTKGNVRIILGGKGNTSNNRTATTPSSDIGIMRIRHARIDIGSLERKSAALKIFASKYAKNATASVLWIRGSRQMINPMQKSMPTPNNKAISPMGIIAPKKAIKVIMALKIENSVPFMAR